MKIKIVITTYNRPKSFDRTIDEVNKWIKDNPSHDISVHIYDDYSDPRNREANRQSSRKGRHRYKCFPKNHGKKQFWELWNYILSDIKQMDFDYVVSLQDDCDYTPNFISEVLEYCNVLEQYDKNFAALNVRSDRLGERCWTNVNTSLITTAGYKFYKTGWVDMIFVANKKFFECLNYRLHPIGKGRWEKDERKSSGVGVQLSNRVVDCGLSIYQPQTKLLSHRLAYSSKMNVHRTYYIEQ